jgi:DNA-binding PadR family transcriptional regulator
MPNTRTFLPLTEPVFFILLSLAPGARHGYAIMKETALISDGRVKMSTSTLYGAIKRLLEQGWIERIKKDEGKENGRIRKYYTLTSQGRRILEAETARMETLVTAAKQSAAGAQT